jgi:hypothetical protein
MKKLDQKGQSTIEFIFTFAFGVSIILLIFNSAINQTTGYMVHYATFMASRTYLTADKHIGAFGATQAALGGAEQKAQAVFNKYNLPFLGVKKLVFKINAPDSGNPANYLTVGATAQFEQSMDVVGKLAGQKKLELVSESFLGKEPTRAECATRVCRAVTGQDNCDNNMDITLFDDGC